MNLIGREGTMGHCFPSALFLFSANPRWRLRRRTHGRERQHFFRLAIFGAANPKMIIPTASDKGVRQDLATVAKNEKIRLPTTVYTKNRYQDYICYDESEITLSTNSDKWVGQYLATTSSNAESANPMPTLLSLANR